MSANLNVDIGQTCQYYPSISTVATNSGASAVVGQWIDMSDTDTFCNVYIAAGGTSGPLLVAVQTAPGPYDVPLGNNAFSGNIFSGGAPLSGSFTDPTSGLAQLPTWVSSGGVFIVNSGLYTIPGGLGPVSNATATSGQFQSVAGYPGGTLPFGPFAIQHAQGGEGFFLSGAFPVFMSGGLAIGAFQRNYQYARLVLISGATDAPFLQAGFIAQQDTTGSGGGYTAQPLVSFVNV